MGDSPGDGWGVRRSTRVEHHSHGCRRWGLVSPWVSLTPVGTVEERPFCPDTRSSQTHKWRGTRNGTRLPGHSWVSTRVIDHTYLTPGPPTTDRGPLPSPTRLFVPPFPPPRGSPSRRPHPPWGVSPRSGRSERDSVLTRESECGGSRFDVPLNGRPDSCDRSGPSSVCRLGRFGPDSGLKGPRKF